MSRFFLLLAIPLPARCDAGGGGVRHRHNNTTPGQAQGTRHAPSRCSTPHNASLKPFALAVGVALTVALSVRSV
ncbi:hypothetical protein CGMCC3_g6597 [Colletotrichum fructicola]|nr:uncharacterized protein CGMCC3_g6597 [Colletotrichum fructicola]KAE9577513.1 hypothetical protein CGMCC3_g6597 [Colletotrichum fructicola]